MQSILSIKQISRNFEIDRMVNKYDQLNFSSLRIEGAKFTGP